MVMMVMMMMMTMTTTMMMMNSVHELNMSQAMEVSLLYISFWNLGYTR
jgi:hypothetical protein